MPNDPRAQAILDEAKEFAAQVRQRRRQSKGRCDFHDYEKFKKRLISQELYGYESQLADILGL